MTPINSTQSIVGPIPGGESSSATWNRREFVSLSAGVIASASCPLSFPEVKATQRASSSPTWFWVSRGGERTAVKDPAIWAVANQNTRLLAEARQRLQQCDPQLDWIRIVRVVLRRCFDDVRAFIHAPDGRCLDVFYWKQPETFERTVRELLHERRLLAPDVQVRLHRLRKMTTVVKTGDDYCYAAPMPDGFPHALYRQKIKNSYLREADDEEYTPWSGVRVTKYAQPFALRWSQLKKAWREPCVRCWDCPGKPAGFVYYGYYPRLNDGVWKWGGVQGNRI